MAGLLAAVIVVCFVALAVCPPADTHGIPAVAGVQVALARRQTYVGGIDGVLGPRTRSALRRFQRHAHLPADGVPGRRTLAALGPFARHRVGSRKLLPGDAGADVAAVQFELAWDGFPSGGFDGRFGPVTEWALRRFQASRAIPRSGIVGPRTYAALKKPPRDLPFALSWPVIAPVGSPFGPRGYGFHSGVDLVAASGTPVKAAAPGRVSWAGPRDGWGLLVTLANAAGVRTMYAHLSSIDVQLGEHVADGAVLGLVGATGDATGPHLHFEVRVDGAAVDPLPHLGAQP